MIISSNHSFKLPLWYWIFPAYLTLWTLLFSLYNLVDGNGMMEAFGIDTGGASDFIMLNSAGRYVALAVAMLVGIWLIRSFGSMLTALLARLSMDILDLWAGLSTGVIQDSMGVLQSFLMFLLPNLIAIGLLFRYKNRASN
ncbi:MAG: hypothetical protein AAF696_22615 [Bacteroidota bacterium]